MATLIDEMPTPSFLHILIFSGPFGLLMHLLAIGSIFVFLWLVWKKAPLIQLLFVAVLPLAAVAVIMAQGNRMLLSLLQDNPEIAPFTVKGIDFIYRIYGWITIGLLLLTAVVFLMRRLKRTR